MEATVHDRPPVNVGAPSPSFEIEGIGLLDTSVAENHWGAIGGQAHPAAHFIEGAAYAPQAGNPLNLAVRMRISVDGWIVCL